MAIRQISVFLENKPGMLETMTEVLAAADIDIRALSLAETKDFGIVRMIVSDVYETATVLKDNHFIASMTPVIAVKIDDKVGGLSNVLKTLSAASVNIEYMYASLAGKGGNACMIFRVEDEKKAEAALRAGGFKLADQETVAEM
ncbi:MAG: acetolactate synthase [Lachnospiraceae bacterium]|nr:acetolactate synthase [Lachnospiraceae bacterium]